MDEKSGVHFDVSDSYSIRRGCKPQVNSSGTPVTTANFTIDPAVPESEAFQLPGLLSSQAVLQQNTVLKMWGQYAVDVR